MKKLILIANPAAGRGILTGSENDKFNLNSIRKIFAENNLHTTVRFTRKRGDALRIALHAGEYDIVVAAGGDGTLHEVVNGMYRASISDTEAGAATGAGATPRPLGYIPMGTTNDFAATWKLSLNPRVAALTIAAAAKSETVSVLADLGLLNKRAFTYVASFGLFCGASAHTPRALKAMFGSAAYYAQGLSELANVPRYELNIDVDGVRYDGVYSMGLFSNSVFIGGNELYPCECDNLGRELSPRFNSCLADGKFEIMLVKYIQWGEQLSGGQSLPDIPKLIDVILKARNGDYDSPYVTFLRGSRISVSGERIEWIVDGESYGYRRSAVLQCLQRRARYIVGC